MSDHDRDLAEDKKVLRRAIEIKEQVREERESRSEGVPKEGGPILDFDREPLNDPRRFLPSVAKGADTATLKERRLAAYDEIISSVEDPATRVDLREALPGIVEATQAEELHGMAVRSFFVFESWQADLALFEEKLDRDQKNRSEGGKGKDAARKKETRPVREAAVDFMLDLVRKRAARSKSEAIRQAQVFIVEKFEEDVETRMKWFDEILFEDAPYLLELDCPSDTGAGSVFTPSVWTLRSWLNEARREEP